MREELRIVQKTPSAYDVTTRDVAAVFFRQRRLVLISFGVVLVGVLLYGALCPSYQAEMKIMLRKGRLDPVVTPSPTQSPQIEHNAVTEEDLNSEAELLTDDEILRTVVQNSGLSRSSWFSYLTGASREMDLARAVRRVARKLEVVPVRKSTLIDVRYASPDPKRSARVLESLESAYLQRHQQVGRPSGQFHFFEEQMQQSREALEQAEFQLMAFSHDKGVVSAAMERDIALQKASSLDTNQQDTLTSVVQTVHRIAALESKIKGSPERTTTLIRNSDNPQLMEKMKSTLLELQLRRTNLLTKFQPSYRPVQEVDEQIAQAKASIAAEERLPLREQTTELELNHEWAKAELMKSQVELTSLESRARANGVALSVYKGEARTLGDRAVQQEELLRNVKAAEEKYLLYANKREEARIGDALDEGGILNVAVVEHPLVPVLPQHSELAFGFIGMLLASLTSTTLAFCADRFNSTFRTSNEVIAYLGPLVVVSLPRGVRMQEET